MNFLQSKSFDDPRPTLSPGFEYFLFQYPMEEPFKAFQDKPPFFYSDYPDAYEVKQTTVLDSQLESGDHIAKKLLPTSVRLIKEFCLPLLFKSTRHYDEKQEIYRDSFLKFYATLMSYRESEEKYLSSKKEVVELFWQAHKETERLKNIHGTPRTDFDYMHELVEMTEEDINKAFFERAYEYLNKEKLEPFLEYQYHNNNKHEPNDWLDNLAHLIENVKQYEFLAPTKMAVLKITKLGKDWIIKKRNELKQLVGSTHEMQQTKPQLVTEELEAELNATSHKVLLLIKLGLIDQVEEFVKRNGKSTGGDDVAKLVKLIIGGNKKTIYKCISAYQTKDLSSKSYPETANAMKNIKIELFKIGITL